MTFHEKCKGKDKVVANAVGMEVACKNPDHQTPLCRKRLHFKVHGGPELTERKLKFWLLQCSSPTQLEHRNVELTGDIPHIDDLETMPFAAKFDVKKSRKS